MSLAEQVLELRREKAELQERVGQLNSENHRLKEQVEVLSDLPEGRLENLSHVQKIEIGGYTGFYDKNKDGKKEKLIVYVKPRDEQGDIIKATGAIDVQLWDLNKEQDQALLGEWHTTPDELKKLWFATLLTNNYRLMFDAPEQLGEPKESLTVKVTFTDYLTGKVFEEQKVIKP
jgi:hypothetical protein